MSDQLTTTASAAPATPDELASELGALTTGKYADDKSFLAVAAGAGWLPRVQLYGSNSGDVKKGRIPMGHYGLVRQKDQITDLTGVLDVLVLAWRPKAMRIDGDDVTSIFNPTHSEFAKIQAESDEKDSGCMFGPEFLIFVGACNPPAFATLFFGNKTMRREAPNMKGLLGRFATLKVQLIETKKYSWHGPVIVPCSTPFGVPSMDEIKKVVDKFNSPPETDIESAPDGGVGTEERVR